MYVIRFASGKFCNLYCLEEGTAEETAASICAYMNEEVRVYDGKEKVLHEFFPSPVSSVHISNAPHYN